MQLPFTVNEFMNVFKSYNESVFPLQILFYIVALYSIYLLFKRKKYSQKIISGFLAFLWLWIGIVYHFLSFAPINKAAYLFGLLFIIQAFLFFIFGFQKERLHFVFNGSVLNYVGILFFLYALLIYPVLGHLLGHQYPYSPTFGLPCPTTIFTFGFLLFVDSRLSFWFYFIPLLWSLIGFSAAVNLSIYEDFGLFIAGVSGLVLLLTQDYGLNKKFS